MYNEIIYLVDAVKTDETDAYGDHITKFATSQVFAKQKSISQTEFWQAQTSEYKPEIKFKIPDYLDYNGQQYLIHENVRYKILKTYRTTENELEITCYGGVRNVGAEVGNEDN